MSVFQVNHAFASETLSVQTPLDRKIERFRRLGVQEQTKNIDNGLKTISADLKQILSKVSSERSYEETITDLKTVDDDLKNIILEESAKQGKKGRVSLGGSKLTHWEEQQFVCIERIIKYIATLCAFKTIQYEPVLKQECEVREELTQLTCKLLKLERLIPEKEQQRIKDAIAMREIAKNKAKESLVEIKWLQTDLEEWQRSLQEADAAYNQFRALQRTSENIWYAKYYLKSLLNPAIEELLPEALREDITRYRLKSSLLEDMENSSWDLVRAFGKMGQSLSTVPINSFLCCSP